MDAHCVITSYFHSQEVLQLTGAFQTQNTIREDKYIRWKCATCHFSLFLFTINVEALRWYKMQSSIEGCANYHPGQSKQIFLSVFKTSFSLLDTHCYQSFPLQRRLCFEKSQSSFLKIFSDAAAATSKLSPLKKCMTSVVLLGSFRRWWVLCINPRVSITINWLHPVLGCSV